jgi:hypothetical protein
MTTKPLSETHPSLWKEIMYSDSGVQSACDIGGELKMHTLDRKVVRDAIVFLEGVYGKNNPAQLAVLYALRLKLGLDGE